MNQLLQMKIPILPWGEQDSSHHCGVHDTSDELYVRILYTCAPRYNEVRQSDGMATHLILSELVMKYMALFLTRCRFSILKATLPEWPCFHDSYSP